VLTLLGVVAVYVPLLRHLGDHTPPRETETSETAIRSRRALGLEALERRDYADAAERLRDARNLYERDRTAIPVSEGRELVQMQRQVELLDAKLPKPLDQLLQEWSQLAPDHLDELFERKGRGKAVFFDLEMVRDGAGRYHYERRLGPELPTLELQNLELLNRLPLQNAQQRVVFGARLAGLQRDALNKFVVSFDAKSGVLVTDEVVAEVCCPPLEENLRAVLQRQKGWATEMP
jgi:hypothetical protein